MATDPFDDILNRAQQLTPEEQLKLIDELAQHAGQVNGKRSILELKGLGKQMWQGIDADEYVRKERESWSG